MKKKARPVYLRTKHGLKALNASAKTNRARYVFDGPHASMLETFEAPGPNLRIEVDMPEFTSLCPITGQPDFATLRLIYCPGMKCVESKSLKLYLMAFRQHGAFHEACIVKIVRDLVTKLHPERLELEGKFTARGGISFVVHKVWSRE